MYSIEIDCAKNLVSVKLAGLMTLTEANGYIADLAHRFVEGGIVAGYLMTIDTSDASLQTQEVISAFQRQIVQFPKARRIAMINGSSLARMQIKRVMTQPYSRVFKTRAEGLAWLMSADSEAIAA